MIMAVETNFLQRIAIEGPRQCGGRIGLPHRRGLLTVAKTSHHIAGRCVYGYPGCADLANDMRNVVS